MCLEFMMGMISSMYVGIYRLAKMYCIEFWDEEFEAIRDELESIIFSSIEEQEQIL